MERDLEMRVRESGVKRDTLQLSVNCGAYPSIEEALDHLDKEVPVERLPPISFSINRMVFINRVIDGALFRLARATSAWTWLEDFDTLFVLIGYQLRGMVIHKELKAPVPFRLILQRQQDGVRFLRFFGDSHHERISLAGKSIVTPIRHLARRMKLPILEVREMLEALVRTCDDGGWVHNQFPFVYQVRRLDEPHRLLKEHRLLIHSPFLRVVP